MGDSGEKSFDPTPARLAKARREGNVARASEVSANIALLAAAGCTCAVVGSLATIARSAFVTASAGATPSAACATLLAFACVPLAGGAIAGACAGLLQAGGLNVVAPSFKWERTNPAEGFKRMLSRETAGHLVRAVAAFVCTAAAAVASSSEVATVLRGAGIATDADAVWRVVTHVVAAAAAVGLACAAFEYAAARNAWLRKLRMSFAEFKREMREQDGDPAVRGRRKSLHRSLARGDVRRVRDAAFVVCNPTHIAVALAYRPPAEPIPRVLVRAADEGTLRVRELAAQHGVPLIENVALARELYAKARVGEVIASEHYVAVAEIVAALGRAGATSA